MPRPIAPAPSIAECLQATANHPRVRTATVAGLLAAFVLMGIVAARTHTPTVDEFVYLPAGLYHLRTFDLSFDPTNPPLLKMAMALPLLAMDVGVDLDPQWRRDFGGWGPWVFGDHFMDQNHAHYLDAYFAARLVVLAIGVVGGLLLFARARALLTPAGALAALALYCTMPVIVAHASLATLDVGLTVLVFGVFCALERFTRDGGLWWAAAAGALVGLAFATKGTAAIFIPLVPVLAAVGWRGWDRARVLLLVQGLLLSGFAAWWVLQAVYGFSGFPLPGPVVEGLRFQAAAGSGGEFPAFLDGEWSSRGWWYYNLVALLYKTPLPALLLMVLGGVVVARRLGRGAGDLWIVLPPLLLLYVLSFHYVKNYGVRYMLPALPFLVLLAGHGVDWLLQKGRAGAIVAAALLAWQVADGVLATPQQLAWFNVLGGGPERARRHLLDSNLDWGQDLGRLAAFTRERGLGSICLGYFGHVDPQVYGIDFTLPPLRPTPGLCAISANFLAGYPYAITWAGPGVHGVRRNQWAWYDRLTPVARVGASIYVFDVSAADARP
jgi:hypothetical protein